MIPASNPVSRRSKFVAQRLHRKLSSELAERRHLLPVGAQIRQAFSIDTLLCSVPLSRMNLVRSVKNGQLTN